MLQRSFGVFDPSQTALFKFKSLANECPFTNPQEIEEAENRETPDPYYFERGEHRDDIPEEVMGNYDTCYDFFIGQILKDRADVLKGYVENGQDCGVAMVELGMVDRDFGPKSIEASMTEFLNSKHYDTSVADITDSVDADQFLKNFAAYAVMLNMDSPINNLNNWYAATTAGGNNDWRIVQYDHNSITNAGTASTLCSAQCGPRVIYWPILRPTCGDTSSHPMVGRIMNNEADTQKYLDYVKEFVDSFDSGAILEVLREYGDSIKAFVVEDPLNGLSLEEYEDSQLGTDLDGYNTEDPAFLKVLELRLIEVRAQLDAWEKGTLPRDGVYGENEVCPDWRASDGEDFIAGDVIVEDSCPSVDDCEIAADCYGAFACSTEGEFFYDDCDQASPFCDSCFPYSKCGTLDDDSSKFVESEVCGTAFAECSTAVPCFDHKSGICAYDGEMLVTACEPAVFCKSCFPYSRCGTALPTDSPSSPPEESPEDEATSGATSASRYVLIIPVTVTFVMTGILCIFM